VRAKCPVFGIYDQEGHDAEVRVRQEKKGRLRGKREPRGRRKNRTKKAGEARTELEG